MTRDQEHLLAAHLDGSLAPERLSEVEALLRENANARRRYRLLAAIDEGLGDFDAERATATSKSTPRSNLAVWLPWALAAAASFLLILQSFRSAPGPSDPYQGAAALKSQVPLRKRAREVRSGAAPAGTARQLNWMRGARVAFFVTQWKVRVCRNTQVLARGVMAT